jgi:hypothetical protein
MFLKPGSTGAYVPKSLFEIDTIRFLTMYILYGMRKYFCQKAWSKLISFNFLVRSTQLECPAARKDKKKVQKND